MAEYELGGRYTITPGDHLGAAFEVEVAAGKKLVIETSPDGSDLLEATVPGGKIWAVRISIDVLEQDA